MFTTKALKTLRNYFVPLCLSGEEFFFLIVRPSFSCGIDVELNAGEGLNL